jgi:hypothetical protein
LVYIFFSHAFWYGYFSILFYFFEQTSCMPGDNGNR